MQSILPNAWEIVRRRLRGDLRGVRCLLIDDVRMPDVEDLKAYPAELIERIELIERGFMVRVYTTPFIRRMVEGRQQLAPLVLMGGTNRPTCS